MVTEDGAVAEDVAPPRDTATASALVVGPLRRTVKRTPAETFSLTESEAAAR